MDNEFQLPGNSYNKKDSEKKVPEADAPKLEQITTGNVVRKKKTLRKKISDLFFQGDARGAADYVVSDVVVPAVKYAIQDSFNQFLSRLLGTEVRSTRPRSGGFLTNDRPGHTPYNTVSSRREDPRPSISQRSRANHDFDEIVFETKVEAIEVLDRLFAQIDEYGEAKVSELYELTGLTGHYTDNKFGWTDLRGSDVLRVREGYLLDLPKPISLD